MVNIIKIGLNKIIELLASFDGGYIHQGCWGWGQEESVAGTAESRTRKAEGQETLTVR